MNKGISSFLYCSRNIKTNDVKWKQKNNIVFDPVNMKAVLGFEPIPNTVNI